jgi:hypothetical protein
MKQKNILTIYSICIVFLFVSINISHFIKSSASESLNKILYEKNDISKSVSNLSSFIYDDLRKLKQNDLQIETNLIIVNEIVSIVNRINLELNNSYSTNDELSLSDIQSINFIGLIAEYYITYTIIYFYL